VEQMAPKGVEVILGASRDERFGPLMMFRPRRILVEVLKDVSFRLAPMWQTLPSGWCGRFARSRCFDGFAATRLPISARFVRHAAAAFRHGVQPPRDFRVRHQPV